MICIRKQKVEPVEYYNIISAVINSPINHFYSDLDADKLKGLREFLINEQRNLCVYCNQKITPLSSTIEHFICQKHNPYLDLNYHNLFAVCRGNAGSKKGVIESHCDKYRANSKKNDYFFPFFLFTKCHTTDWDNLNPFFEVQYNRRTKFLSGKIMAKEKNIEGFPTNKPRIERAIYVLNLNAEILVEARKDKWKEVLKTKAEKECNWKELFDYYLALNPFTEYHEFVLLAIRKHEI